MNDVGEGVKMALADRVWCPVGRPPVSEHGRLDEIGKKYKLQITTLEEIELIKLNLILT